MMTCAKNHVLIEWHNPLAVCPACDALEDLARVSAELDSLKAEQQATKDAEVVDLECRKGFSHAAE